MSAKVLEALKAAHASAIESLDTQHGDAIAWIKPDQLLAVATWLKNDPAMAFDAPVFVTCIDRLDWKPVDVPPGQPIYPTTAAWTDDGARPRFEVVYQLRSSLHRHRLRLKCAVPEHDPRVPSLATLWPAFNWQERETYDMYGIKFEGHPDLRRIYLYEEFVGYPLRKDYPKEKRQPLVRRDDLLINPIKSTTGGHR
jgi:NADH-quinone oxidoreductase subunit C